MITFFSDLDNTLIYSHRREIGELKTVAEYLKGREQSFMSLNAFSALKAMCEDGEICLIPITTRHKEQFERVFLLKELGVGHALVNNGGELLVDGVPDPKWHEETLALSRKAQPKIEAVRNWLYEHLPAEKVHVVDVYMVYGVCETAAELAERLKAELDTEGIFIGCDQRKVYAIAGEVNKGTAIARYRERFATKTIVAAGDSEFDVPMLNQADYALYPEALCGKVKDEGRGCVDTMPFCDGICEALQGIKKQYQGL